MLQPELHRAMNLAKDARDAEAEEVMQGLLRRFPDEPHVHHLLLKGSKSRAGTLTKLYAMPVASPSLADDDPNLLFLAADRVRWGDPGLSLLDTPSGSNNWSPASNQQISSDLAPNWHTLRACLPSKRAIQTAACDNWRRPSHNCPRPSATQMTSLSCTCSVAVLRTPST